MAAWRRSGRIEKHRERLISRMENKGIPRNFAERVFEQIRGFGEYGFPESHAASFALIAYATSWLRRHYLPEFLCSLLNAQPMGFYQPATLVADAQRHGVEVRPIDVTASAWDCTMELGGAEPAVRMGLRWVRGLPTADGERILAARQERDFASLADFSRRARLPTRSYDVLAEAGALGALSASRREALWQLAGWSRRQADGLALGDAEAPVPFAALDRFEEIAWDFSASDHSTRGHPLGPLRAELTARRHPAASAVNRLRDGHRVEYVGLVICRQRPATASGVTFMTLEDETGLVNVVIWSHVFERHAVIARTAALLGVTGILQVQEGITHLIAESLWAPRLSSRVTGPASRDFH
jgi:error-prone DNA polymerase